ncbi:MAG: hypothetical protein P4L46_25520 [Fimbriimonas sp.]|nr:hypothetical protein [Fimbriimonas sp.]
MPWSNESDADRDDKAAVAELSKQIGDLATKCSQIRSDIEKWSPDLRAKVNDSLAKTLTLCVDPWRKYTNDNKDAKQAPQQAQIAHKHLAEIYQESLQMGITSREVTSLRHILARVELTFRLFLEDRGIGLLHDIHKSGKGRPETQRVSHALIQDEEADELRRRLKEVEDGINAAGIPFKRTTSGQDLKEAIDVLRDLSKKGSGGEAKATAGHDLLQQIELLERRHKQLSSVLASIGILFAPEDRVDELVPQIEVWVQTRRPIEVPHERGEAAVELARPSEEALRLSEIEKALAEAGIRLKRNEPVRLLTDAIEAIKSRQVDASGESKRVRELQDKVRSLEEEFKSKEAFAERAFVEAKDGYQKELAAHKKANASLEERIASTLKTTAKQLDKVDEEKQELAGKNDLLRIRNRSLEADAAAKTTEADELKLRNNELAGQSRDRGATIELLKQELAAVKLTLTETTTRLNAANERILTQETRANESKAALVEWRDFCPSNNLNDQTLRSALVRAQKQVQGDSNLSPEFRDTVLCDLSVLLEVLVEWGRKSSDEKITSNEFATLIDCTAGRPTVEDEPGVRDDEAKRRMGWRALSHAAARTVLGLVLERLGYEIIIPKPGFPFEPAQYDQRVGRQEDLIGDATPGSVARCVRVGVKSKEDSGRPLEVPLRAMVVRYTWDEARIAGRRHEVPSDTDPVEADVPVPKPPFEFASEVLMTPDSTVVLADFENTNPVVVAPNPAEVIQTKLLFDVEEPELESDKAVEKQPEPVEERTEPVVTPPMRARKL